MKSFIMNNIQEEWKSVPSEPDLEVSSLGRVRVVLYKASVPNGGTTTYGGIPKFIAYCKTRTGKNNPFVKGRSQCQPTS